MTLRSTLMVSLALFVLTACSSKPAPDLYVLRAPEDKVSCTGKRSLLIHRPIAPNEYDSKRIAIMLSRNHLSYYTGASWASPFPEQLQDVFMDAFNQRGVTVVDGADDDAIASSTLKLTIHEANVRNVSAPVVHLRLSGTVTDPSGGIARFRVNEAVPAEENHMPQIIAAYDKAAANAVIAISKAMKLRCS